MSGRGPANKPGGGDSQERIDACLSCPYPVCVDCFARGKGPVQGKTMAKPRHPAKKSEAPSKKRQRRPPEPSRPEQTPYGRKRRSEADRKTYQVHAAMDYDLVCKFDEYCAANDISTSEGIRRAIAFMIGADI